MEEATMDIDRQRIAAVRALEAMGLPTATGIAAADAMHATLER
jgi:hypothetical protein